MMLNRQARRLSYDIRANYFPNFLCKFYKAVILFNGKNIKGERIKNMTTTLDSISENKTVKVIDISGGWGVRQRLSGLGIHPGDVITVKKSAIVRGPILISVHGNQVALGRGVARKIIVEVEE
ncbi:MAG: hypothetical protein XE08_0059 [Parcubacteria bacterium 32_520]|nr:MAG: hypothetical protein XE08_0059 [Parcubacteria bacterium 32_520]